MSRIGRPRWYVAWIEFVDALRAGGVRGPLVLTIGTQPRQTQNRRRSTTRTKKRRREL